MKRVDIKTGFLCNNNCIFCVQADNKFKGNRTLDEIKQNLIECKKTCNSAVFTGGEVTIRDDFFEFIKFAKKLGYKKIQIQSNGRMFNSLKFCKKTIEAGADQFALSLHGYNPKQHDEFTRSPGSFLQVVKGIKNLKKLGADILINTVIVKQNYKDLPKIAKLLVSLDVNQFQFSFLHIMGNAFERAIELTPTKTEIMPYLKKALQIGIDSNISVMIEAIPFCLLEKYYKYSSDYYMPDTMIRGLEIQNTDDFTKQRRDSGKVKFKQCKECKFDLVCEGPWREYPEIFGNSEFKPVKDSD